MSIATEPTILTHQLRISCVGSERASNTNIINKVNCNDDMTDPDIDPEITIDSETTVDQLKTMVETFVAERDWNQFHSPKNLSMALSIEAAELMEHFQWISMDESRNPEPEKLAEIGEELADVLCYAMGLANELNIDIAAAMKSKMLKNRQKYPRSEFKGRYGKDAPPVIVGGNSKPQGSTTASEAEGSS